MLGEPRTLQRWLVARLDMRAFRKVKALHALSRLLVTIRKIEYFRVWGLKIYIVMHQTGTPNKETQGQKEAAEQTLAFWQPRSSRRLSAEDARQMIENVTGLFSQLSAWDGQGQSTALVDSVITAITAAGPSAIDECESTQEIRSCNPVDSSLAA